MLRLLRGALGLVAAVLAVLVFHQGMVWLLYANGLVSFRPYDLAPYGPLQMPRLVDLCFWGGLYGIVFGVALPWLPRWPGWVLGLGLGLLAVLVGWFVVAPLKGLPVASGWALDAMARSLVINGFWGLVVGIITPRLIPRALARA